MNPAIKTEWTRAKKAFADAEFIYIQDTLRCHRRRPVSCKMVFRCFKSNRCEWKMGRYAHLKFSFSFVYNEFHHLNSGLRVVSLIVCQICALSWHSFSSFVIIRPVHVQSTTLKRVGIFQDFANELLNRERTKDETHTNLIAFFSVGKVCRRRRRQLIFFVLPFAERFDEFTIYSTLELKECFFGLIFCKFQATRCCTTILHVPFVRSPLSFTHFLHFIAFQLKWISRNKMCSSVTHSTEDFCSTLLHLHRKCFFFSFSFFVSKLERRSWNNSLHKNNEQSIAFCEQISSPHASTHSHELFSRQWYVIKHFRSFISICVWP